MNHKLIAWCINNLLIIAGFLPLFILWWATPPFDRKYALGFIFRTQGIGEALFYPSVNFFGRVLFYLQSLISSYNFSFWLGLGCLTALGASFGYLNDKKIRLILLMFLANIFMISLVGNIQERYLSTAAPVVFILLAYIIVMLIEIFKRCKKVKVVVYATILFLAIAIAYDALNLTRYTKEVANRSILFFIYKDSLNQFSPPFLFGLIKRPSFTYPMEQIKKYINFPSKPVSRIEGIMDYFRENIDRHCSISSIISYHDISPYDIYWSFHDWSAPIMTANDLAYTGKYFWLADYFIDIQAAPSSPYYINWLDKGWSEKYGPILLKSGYVKLMSSKEFTDLGLTAYVYKRIKSPYE